MNKKKTVIHENQGSDYEELEEDVTYDDNGDPIILPDDDELEEEVNEDGGCSCSDSNP